MERLDGEVAIVFGAGPNIGGVAHFLARDGARVAVSDLNADATREAADFITARGFEACALTGSAAELASVARIVAATGARYARSISLTRYGEEAGKLMESE